MEHDDKQTETFDRLKVQGSWGHSFRSPGAAARSAAAGAPARDGGKRGRRGGRGPSAGAEALGARAQGAQARPPSFMPPLGAERESPEPLSTPPSVGSRLTFHRRPPFRGHCPKCVLRAGNDFNLYTFRNGIVYLYKCVFGRIYYFFFKMIFYCKPKDKLGWKK